jgi:hypothetical protein
VFVGVAVEVIEVLPPFWQIKSEKLDYHAAIHFSKISQPTVIDDLLP